MGVHLTQPFAASYSLQNRHMDSRPDCAPLPAAADAGAQAGRGRDDLPDHLQERSEHHQPFRVRENLQPQRPNPCERRASSQAKARVSRGNVEGFFRSKTPQPVTFFTRQCGIICSLLLHEKHYIIVFSKKSRKGFSKFLTGF